MHQKMFVKKIISCLLLVAIFFSMADGLSFCTLAAAPENIDVQIGLFYGQTAKDSVSLSLSQGAVYACMRSDDSVNNMWQNPADTSLTVKKYSQYYVKMVNASWSYADAKWLAGQYTNAYPGNFDGMVGVVICGYQSLAEAQKQADVLKSAGYAATACAPHAGMVLVNNNSGGAFAFAATDGHLVIKPISTNVVTIGQTSYNGSVAFKRLSTGDMTVVNVVNMYDYLASVVGQEMSPSWPSEALKVQAVAAKCYALTSLTRFKKYGFQMDATTNTQVYLGTAKATATTRAAVEATKGVQVLYNGQVAQTFFFSSDGGKTEDAQYIWGNDVPYLKGVQDPYEKASEATYGTWSVTLTKAEIAEKLKAKGIDLGEITSVAVTARTPVGRVRELTITGTKGSKTFTKSACYSTLGLKSSNYSIAGSGESVSPAVSATVITGSGTQNVNLDQSYVATKNGVTALSGGNYAVATRQGITEIASQTSAATGESGATDRYTFNGGGWGHGVGISQWGAKAMADAGYSYRDIISFYLTGVTITN